MAETEGDRGQETGVTRQELFVGGKHLGTYVNNTTYFSHGDCGLTKKGRYPLPPDVQQKLNAAEREGIPSEQYAQEVEQKINRELQPPK